MHKQPSLWRQIQRLNFIDLEKLANFLELSVDQKEKIVKKPKFVLNIPLRLANKISKNTLEDPILRQFIPLEEENRIVEGFNEDPVCDHLYRKESQLLHKYIGRALLVCTSACAMHCRYCFRQNFDYSEQNTLFNKELELIRQDASLHEIILSGGDPLSLENTTISSLLNELESIAHIRRVRIHTRFPIGIPERLDEGFLSLLERKRLQIWFVVHVNHPRELDAEILDKLKSIQKLGIPVLNQSVLLKGVNDTVEVQKELCEKLVDHGILPYYLHQLDRVQGTSHFEVNPDQGRLIIQTLMTSLSGYAVPKYVKEIPGALSKTSLGC